MRVLVTGANGFVGRHLVPRLLDEGHEVVRLHRGVANQAATHWGIPTSLRSAECAPGFPTGIEVVVHLAAANPAKGDEGADNAARLQEVNVEGTAALARRCVREGVRRFVFLSSANVHAFHDDGSSICEADRLGPQSYYAQSKADGENAVRQALAGTQTRYCILRPAPVFGMGGRGTVAQLARLAATPFPLPLRGLGGRRSLVAVEDLVEAIVLALTAERASDETFLVAGGAARPDEIVRALRAGAERRPRLLPAPVTAARALARSLGKEQAFDTLTRDFVLDASRAEAMLGWRLGADLSSRLRALGHGASGRSPSLVYRSRRREPRSDPAAHAVTGSEANASQRPLRVLVLTQYYWPETFLINEVVDDLRKLGCEVTVLTGQPNYPDGNIFSNFRAWGVGRERHLHGYDIYRVPVVPRRKGGFFRAFNYASFIISAGLIGPLLIRRREHDVVFVYAVSPILQALPAILVSRLKRAALVVWVQDLWPDTLRSAGGITNQRVLDAVAKVTRFIYRRCDLLLAQSNGFVPRIRDIAQSDVPIVVHPNPGPSPDAVIPVDRPLEMTSGFNIVFAGNFGTAQSMGTILDAAELVEDPECRFVLVGSGSRSAWLAEEIERRGLNDRVRLAGRFPSGDMPAILHQASALLVTLARSENLSLTIPSKVPAYFAAGKPILASLDGEANDVINRSGAGLAVPAEDGAALADAVSTLLAMTDEERAAFGQAGRDYYLAHFSPPELAVALENHLRKAVDAKRMVARDATQHGTD